MVDGRIETRWLADRAWHIGKLAALPADDVVVIVVTFKLVLRASTVDSYPAQNFGVGECVEDVIDSLLRHGS